jgi:hypothetical protein
MPKHHPELLLPVSALAKPAPEAWELMPPVKAANWSEVFPNPEAGQVTLHRLIADTMAQYQEGRVKEEVFLAYLFHRDAQGDHHMIARTDDAYTEIRQSPDGDIAIITRERNEAGELAMYRRYLVPTVGRIDHPFSDQDVRLPPMQVERVVPKAELTRIIGMSWRQLEIMLRPRLATTTEELAMQRADRVGPNGKTPIRIGYHLYGASALAALARLRAQHPGLWDNKR